MDGRAESLLGAATGGGTTACDLECLPAGPRSAAVDRALLQDEAARLEPWRDLLQGMEIWDVHGHVGCDIDARQMSAAQRVEQLDALGFARSVVFPMNDPRQGFCFEHPNDLIWEAYQAFPDRLIPFFRLNPNFPSRVEYERRLAQGFQGIKLHPRSQSFRIAQPEAMTIYGWAEADGLPILVHTGKGAHQIAEDVKRVVDAHPALRLILGHSAAAELPHCCSTCHSCDWILFETSTLDRDQLRELMGRIDPSKIAFGSDVPFRGPAEDLVRLLEAAAEVGLSAAELELILGGNLRRWLTQPRECRGECALESGGSPAPVA
jgi:predicted TIM-barrel fold metal-dependent hydrolase